MNTITNVGQFKQELTRFEGQISSVAQQLSASLPSHISVEKFQRTLMAAVKADPELLRADRASLVNACEKAALDGLLPDKREAALVIFKRNYKDGAGNWQQALDVAYMPMAYGLRKKILQSGEVTDITAKVVYRREHEEGAFLYEEGTEAMLRHRPLLDLTEEEGTDENIVAVYSMATYKDGTKSYEVMRRFEVDRVRECSQTGATKDRNGKARKSFGPWVDFYPEMAKKTAMRRHSKTLPMSGDLMIDVEGRELDATANSAARMLAIEPDAPISLPRGDDDNDVDDTDQGNQREEAFDPATGEVLQRDSRGMTEVDENTARALDRGEDAGDDDDGSSGAGEDTEAAEDQADEQRGENTAPQADHVGPTEPKNARHGESWFNPDDSEEGRIKYAHQTAGHGVKWYLEPPKDDAPGTSGPASDVRAGFSRRISEVTTKAQLDAVEKDFLKVSATMGDEDVSEIEGKLRTKRKALAGRA